MDESRNRRQKAVPKTRASRLFRMARMAGGVAAGALAERGRQLGNGKKPQLKDLILSPANARRVTRQLSDMRGAAMKLGQILSMDGAGIVPPELADILADLRANATSMPDSQLHAVMKDNLGEDWRSQFSSFSARPVASASIGQVHQAVSLDGEALAVKVQYPGVASSIDSDVDNMASLLGLTGLVPAQVDVKPLLDDAKKLLRQEADYETESEFLNAFYEHLKDDERFIIPSVYKRLSGPQVLTMSFIEGFSIEFLARERQEHIDQAMANLFALFFEELFELRMVQTDPNFANYRYLVNKAEDTPVKIGLLDFGATQRFTKKFTDSYRQLLKATIKQDDQKILSTANKLGYELEDASDEYKNFVLDIFYLALEPLLSDGVYDFSKEQLNARVADMAQESHEHRKDWTAPPTETLYIHRKLGGLYMLAERIGAKVNLSELLLPYLRSKTK